MMTNKIDHSYEFETPFDPKPKSWNHQCHYRPWSEHYKNDENEVIRTLALMLGDSLDRDNKLCDHAYENSARHAALMFAYIFAVERIPKFFHWLIPVPTNEPGTMASAFGCIKILNEWRAENKRNIKEWEPYP